MQSDLGTFGKVNIDFIRTTHATLKPCSCSLVSSNHQIDPLGSHVYTFGLVLTYIFLHILTLNSCSIYLKKIGRNSRLNYIEFLGRKGIKIGKSVNLPNKYLYIHINTLGKFMKS